MAEGILRDRWAKIGRDDLSVSSMGIHALDGQPASEFARQVCREQGIDISAHVSRQLVYDELTAAHLILMMEQVQKEFVKTFFPRIDEKLSLLGAWPDSETRKSNIDDPMGGTLKAYRRAFDAIAFHIDRILPVLVERFG